MCTNVCCCTRVKGEGEGLEMIAVNRKWLYALPRMRVEFLFRIPAFFFLGPAAVMVCSRQQSQRLDSRYYRGIYQRKWVFEYTEVDQSGKPRVQ